jgi:hypothetical protein
MRECMFCPIFMLFAEAEHHHRLKATGLTAHAMRNEITLQNKRRKEQKSPVLTATITTLS